MTLPRPAQLAAANGRLELARTVAFAGGPALAGALVGWTGGTPAFAVAAALSTCAVFRLAGRREPARPAPPPRDPVSEIREGAGFVFGHRLLRPVYVTQFVFNTAFFILQAVYVPYAVHRLGLSASAVGAATGALIGAVYGAETCLVVAAIGFLVQAAVIVCSPVLRLTHQPEMAGRAALTPSTPRRRSSRSCPRS